jgi:ATP-dependent protease HslVU (ClpYQ) peptidase subunit
MTCIVGVTSETGVVLGADSLHSNGFTWHEAKTPKLFKPRPWLALGYTTSWRWGQLLGQMLRQVRIDEQDHDAFEWMLSVFVPTARKATKDGGWMGTDEGREEGGVALAAVRNRLFLLQPDWSVLETAAGIDACGSGEYHALTAMICARDLEPDMAAVDVAGFGLRHAELQVTTVRAPFHFVETST